MPGGEWGKEWRVPFLLMVPRSCLSSSSSFLKFNHTVCHQLLCTFNQLSKQQNFFRTNKQQPPKWSRLVSEPFSLMGAIPFCCVLGGPKVGGGDRPGFISAFNSPKLPQASSLEPRAIDALHIAKPSFVRETVIAVTLVRITSCLRLNAFLSIGVVGCGDRRADAMHWLDSAARGVLKSLQLA